MPKRAQEEEERKMLKTLFNICLYLNNFFDRGLKRLYGTILIENGAISNPEFYEIIQDGQYFRIVNSIFNDGIYKYEANKAMNLHDESFVGAVWLMAIPQDIIDLANEVEAWVTKYNAVDSPNMSPFNSESFGGYSYTKSSGNSENEANLGANTWQGVFASRLNPWRKLK